MCAVSRMSVSLSVELLKPNTLYSINKKKNKATQSRAFSMIRRQKKKAHTSQSPPVSAPRWVFKPGNQVGWAFVYLAFSFNWRKHYWVSPPGFPKSRFGIFLTRRHSDKYNSFPCCYNTFGSTLVCDTFTNQQWHILSSGIALLFWYFNCSLQVGRTCFE